MKRTHVETLLVRRFALVKTIRITKSCGLRLVKNLREGPLTLTQVDDMFPGGWSPVRRFGVRQSSGDTTKLRPIDDYSECKVNQAFGYCDKIDLRAMDELVWILRAWTF